MTTDPELVPVAQLRELLAKATPGPWEVLGDNQGHPCGLEWTIEAPQLADEDYTGWIAGVHGGDGIATTGNPGCRADAELIAAAVNALPALLDELDALRATIADHARIVAAAKFRGDNHAETLRSIARMNPATEGERMKQWARDGLSGYTETAEATLAQQMDRAQAAESELAALRARVEAAPVGRVPRAKVGDLLLMSVSHDMGGKRVRLLIEEESNAVR